MAFWLKLDLFPMKLIDGLWDDFYKLMAISRIYFIRHCLQNIITSSNEIDTVRDQIT